MISSAAAAAAASNVATNANFHEDLLQLRQNWRLKRTGKLIVGDLSYRSTGSRFWQSGVFEVRKADDEDMQVNHGLHNSLSMSLELAWKCWYYHYIEQFSKDPMLKDSINDS